MANKTPKTLRPVVLIIDDEISIRTGFKRTLELNGFNPLTADSASTAREVLHSQRVDAVLLDLDLPDVEQELDFLAWIRGKYPQLPIIIVTGDSRVTTAVAAIKLGAFDYVTKPVMADRLLLTLGNTLERKSLRDRADNFEELVKGQLMLGDSPPMRELRAKIEQVAVTEYPILLRGESGTGKELAARMIHARSRRNSKLFIPVNCGGLSKSLIESELFGHKRGSFSGAIEDRAGKFSAADGGTIFLDEIGDLPQDVQSILLRTLQQGEIQRIGEDIPAIVNTRVIAATNQPLEDWIEEGRFRKDLLCRLNTFEIYVPPIRDRKADILQLIEHYIEKSASANDMAPVRLDPEARELLVSHDWPENVREIEKVAARLVVSFQGMTVSKEEIQEVALIGQDLQNMAADYESSKNAFEIQYFSNLLNVAGHNVNEVSRKSGLDRAYVYRKLRKLGLWTKDHST